MFNVLLQVLDDGRLTDNKGRTVNFKNTIIIMTSNMGSSLIRDRFASMTDANREQTIEATKRDVLEMLKSNVRPEFLNRIDEVIMFAPLTKDQIQSIVGLQIDALKSKLAATGINLTVTDAALALLADRGYDPEFGARPVRRVVQRDILNTLSKSILSGTVDRVNTIVVDANADSFVFRNE